MTSSTLLDHDVVSDHVTINTVKNTYTLTGALSGTAVSIEKDVIHNRTTASGSVITENFHGRANFTGTLDGKSGTLVIRYEGHANSTFVHGTFVIGHGTADLTGVHGQGKFSTMPSTVEGAPPVINYTLHWQVAHPEGPQAEDKDHDHDDNGNDD